MIRTFTELSNLQTFEDRFRYLQLNGTVGKETFGFDRFINQRVLQVDGMESGTGFGNTAGQWV